MIVTKKALAVSIAAGQSHPTVQIQPGGITAATDGHMLAEYTPTSSPSGKYFPDRGFDATANLKDPVQITADSAAALSKAMPKGTKVPVDLRNIAALDVASTAENGTVAFHVTDLESSQTLNPAKVADFPNYHTVKPDHNKQGPEVGMDPDLLIRVCKMAKAQGIKCLAFSFAAGTDKDSGRELAPSRPIVVRGQDTDGKLYALIMPMHLG